MPPRRLRLDAELVRRGLARSREHASELVAAGRVSVNKAVATKPATAVTTDADLVVHEDRSSPDYASRGGHKLAGALEAFKPLVKVSVAQTADGYFSTGTGYTAMEVVTGGKHQLCFVKTAEAKVTPVTVLPTAESCKPYVDAAVATDRTKAFVGWKP